MGMVIGLLNWCCLKISTKLFLKTKPIYIFICEKNVHFIRCVTASFHGARTFDTVSTTILYQIHPQITKPIVQVIFALTFNTATKFYGKQRFIFFGSTRSANKLSSEPNKSCPHPHYLFL
jgi:hypothetical protein